MSIFDELLQMSVDEKKAWAKQWLRALRNATEKAGKDPRKVQQLGEMLAQRQDELIAALIIATVKDEYMDDVLELRETLGTTLLGVGIRTAMGAMQYFKR